MKRIKIIKSNLGIILIVILSSVLNFVNLNIEGYSNTYYSSAVKSMTLSLKNFFFVSFDPAGFVSIDKPPIGFWLEAISAKIFGFNSIGILLPEAIAGVISVILIYIIVKRSFGNISALISALTLAITPVFVAVSRNNTIDNILLMTLLLACLALLKAAEKGKVKLLLISFILVGIGFNIKMLEAYLVIPAIYITYLLATNVSIKKKIIHFAIGTVVLIAVSLSWAIVVDLVPASARPFVDSSTNNTVMELILGHNGSERLSFSSNAQNGGAPSFGGQQASNAHQPPNNSSNKNSSDNNKVNMSSKMGNENPPSGNMPNGNIGFGGGNQGSQLTGSFGGETTQGFARLFSKNMLSDQIVWFIPLALFGILAAFLKEKLTFKLDNDRKQQIMLWTMWFVPVFIYFSFNTGTFHPYYLTMLAPPIAALAGIGLTEMWNLYKEGGLKSWLLPIALLANGVVQLLMLSYFISSSLIIIILIALLMIFTFVSSIILIFLNLIKRKKEGVNNLELLKVKKIFIITAFIGLLFTPMVGSGAVLFNELNGTIPVAGLELLSESSKGFVMAGNNVSTNSKLVQYLKANKTSSEKYLLVVANSNSASDIIINSGESVMSLGGFLGSDNIISLDEFKQLAKNGEVRFVMVSENGVQGGNSSSSISAIMNWVKANGKKVASSEYSNASSSGNNMHGQNGSNGQLYDLKAYTDSNKGK